MFSNKTALILFASFFVSATLADPAGSRNDAVVIVKPARLAANLQVDADSSDSDSGPSAGVSVSAGTPASDLPTDNDGIIAAAVVLDDGDYIFTNVANGVNLTYSRGDRGQELYPDDGPGSPLTLKTMGDSYTVIKPRDANNKCASAQWDYVTEGGCDWALALYACKVFSFSKRHLPNRLNSRAVALRLAKQYQYLIPATTAGAYKVVPVDHLHDMPPRAMDNGQRTATANGKSRYPALNRLDHTDLTQEWYITPA